MSQLLRHPAQGRAAVDTDSQKKQALEVTLDQLPANQPARITAVDCSNAVMLRLMEMGLVPGADIKIRKRAPFGGPLELVVSDYVLSIRCHHATHLRVECL